MRKIVQTTARVFALKWPIDGREREVHFPKGQSVEIPDDLFDYLMERSGEPIDWKDADQLGEEVG